ncbi:hypothetical protein SDC9_193632 [bioreactor metagenome]|uniref:Uncharacterized protein n=1 Tax=bioreactor metagenome TaxID=1076179 RepID=A0A645I5K0_9ZZZZ
MNQSFNGVGQLHKESEAGDGGDDPLEHLTQAGVHVLSFLHVIHFAFRFFCHSLHLAGNKGSFGYHRVIAFQLGSGQLAVELLFDDAVNLQIGVTADRRGKVTVIFGSQTKVAQIIR